ncbi:homocysteine S-methyltransferase family protein [Amycolatopsis rhizosphaerae]|uniref:Homocysteine S-methyltransferase family protein n=1 Tax=Amycolatopsis rhizosphaerae TaxID=2053003 RepID=A0A558DHK1_9PSEU|nr:homocysteine S-methyltransferase family protein [Amycolatopsis rhizosphaerae]TVT60492.1 homocysteine S-methyltransferase family protein [Amycolatopsis rhizosphaerae]
MSTSGRVHRHNPVILDGGLSTGLEHEGEPIVAPWWSARCLIAGPRRERVRRVHAAHVDAGAAVVTANTFRCNLRTLRGVDLDPGSGHAWMVHAAVGVARRAAGSRARVAGSVGPVADAYRPDLVPEDDELREEHRWLAVELSRAGVDLVLVETMNTAREALIATEAVLAAGLEPWVSFVCGDDARLLSGEPVAVAARAVADRGAAVLGINCTTPGRTGPALRALREVYDGPLLAQPNVEDRTAISSAGPRPVAVGPAALAQNFAEWHDEVGLAVVGGCCGATAEHVAALAARFAPREAGDPVATGV